MAAIRVTGKLSNGQPLKAVTVEATDALRGADPFARLLAEAGHAGATFDSITFRRRHIKKQTVAFGDAAKAAKSAESKPATAGETKAATGGKK